MVIAVTRLPTLLVYARVHFLDQLRSAGTVDDLDTSLRFTKSPVSKVKSAMPRAIPQTLRLKPITIWITKWPMSYRFLR